MKKYVKPALEFIELRPEEKLSQDCLMHDGLCAVDQAHENSNWS